MNPPAIYQTSIQELPKIDSQVRSQENVDSPDGGHRLFVKIPELLDLFAAFPAKSGITTTFHSAPDFKISVRVDEASEDDGTIRGTGTITLTSGANFAIYFGSWKNSEVRADSVKTNYAFYENGTLTFWKETKKLGVYHLSKLRKREPIYDLAFKINYDLFTLMIPLDPRRAISIQTCSNVELDVELPTTENKKNTFPLCEDLSVLRLYKDILAYSRGVDVPLMGRLEISSRGHSIQWISIAPIGKGHLTFSELGDDPNIFERLFDESESGDILEQLGSKPPYLRGWCLSP